MNKPFLTTVLGLMFCLAGALLLSSISTQAASNTMVRFHVTYGGNFFGDVDVELFDQEKPVTVSNFLAYVRSGTYFNTCLHRAAPQTGPAILQGGGFIVPNPYSPETWECAPDVEAGAPITNEFNVVPLRSNTYGTLAMAKVDFNTNITNRVTGPDSATSQWFFNLADNSYLDTNNGGFTVFGRVVRGTAVLNYFTTARNGDGLIGEFPVAYRHLYVTPRSIDIFRVDIAELPVTDSARPTVAITSPASNQRFSNATLVVTGTARDAKGVSNVWIYPDSCSRMLAVGTTNWTFTLTNAPPGTNFIMAESLDAAGNRSPVMRRSFFRVLHAPLTVLTNGHGTVTGAINGQLLEIGRNYPLTAKPSRGHLFLRWQAVLPNGTNEPQTILEPNPRVVVFLQSNISLTAMFLTNPFPAIKGAYTGLFINTLNISTNNSEDLSLIFPKTGAITLTLTDLGRFTGKLSIQGKSHSFSGTFPPDTGMTSVRIARAGIETNYINLSLNLTNQNELIEGYVYQPNDPGAWSSPMKMFRVRTGTSASPSPAAGTYTVVLPGSTNSPLTLPAGDSFGRVTVGVAGKLSFTGTLADGTPVTQGVAVSTNGLWPLHFPLYSGKGSVISWVQFDTNRPADDLSGLYAWFRPSLAKSKLFTNSFKLLGDLNGSRYRPPVGATNRVTDFTNGMVSLTDGNLAGPLTNLVVLGANNVVTNLSTNKFTLKLTKSTGLFSGTVTPTNATKAISFKGAVLQKQNYGAGFFLGTNQSGRAYFGP